MDILHVSRTFCTIKGGAERYIEGLSKYLVKRGHQVHVYSFYEEPVLISANDDFKILGNIGITSAFSKHTYDVVHVHGYRTIWNNCVGLYAKMLSNKVVLTTHGIYPVKGALDNLKKKAYDNTLGKINLKMFDGFIALTKETKDSIEYFGAPEKKVSIIPNSIDLARFAQPPSSLPFLNSIGLESRRLILYVGRIDWNKGLEFAMRSLARVVKDNPDIVFAIVGNDFGYKRNLEDLSNFLGIRSHVIFAGQIPEHLLLSAYKSAELVVLPSVYEGLPTTVLESMALGVPVVATKSGGTGLLIQHMSNGLLVDYNDEKMFSEMINLLLSDLTLRSKIVQNGKATVKDCYNWEVNARKVEEVYRSALKS